MNAERDKYAVPGGVAEVYEKIKSAFSFVYEKINDNGPHAQIWINICIFLYIEMLYESIV